MTAATPQADTQALQVQPIAPVAVATGFQLARRTVAELKAARAQVIDLMAHAMQKDIHYGKIPGTPKPTLYKAGAEMLCSMFGIGSRPLLVEDLSQYDEIRYRVSVELFDRLSGASLGVGIGECSSNEAKYRWRRPVCDEEFNETGDDRKRVVWKRDPGSNSVRQQRQIRTEPADVANTILKMAKKRGLIDGTLVVTAASDVFMQDAEDLPDEWFGDEPEGAPVVSEQADPKPLPTESQTNGTPSGVRVESVRAAQTGKNERGEWTRFVVKFTNGIEASTYSETLAKAAKELQASKAIVDYEIENDTKNRPMIALLKEKK